MSKTAHVERDTAEWVYMWEKLHALPINTSSVHPGSWVDGWQYMGSVFRDNEWLHEFRHRNPPVNENINVKIVASPDFEPIVINAGD
jgi:hypothetical protein